MKHSDVTISIVCHSAFEECKRCLRVVLDTREGAKLILTANGNAEVAEYFEKLAAQRENIEVVVNIQNCGFIGPSNHAFSLCDTPFFVLLNDDAVPSADWLDKLKLALSSENTVIAGPTGYRLDDNFVGGKPGWPPDYIEGSCMLVKTEALRPMLFAPDLEWAYCEDADLCLRVRSLGYDIEVADLTLFHKPGTTTRTVPHLHDAIRRNFEVCRKRWAHYLRTRSFT